MKIKVYIKETKGDKFCGWFNTSFLVLVGIYVVLSQTIIVGIPLYAMSFVCLVFACYLGYLAYKKKDVYEQTIECEKYEVLKDEK